MTDNDDVRVYADDDPFVMLPESVLYHEQISDRGMRLWAVLRRHSGKEGRICPGRARLAVLLRCSTDTVDRAKSELVDLKLLEVIHRWMCKTCGPVGERCKKNGHESVQLNNHYKLLVPGVAAAVRPGGGRTPAATPSRTDAARVAAPVRPELEHLNESKGTRTSVAPDGATRESFETFWQSYPRRNGRRVGKADAQKRWGKLSGEERTKAQIAVEHYRTACDADQAIAMDAHRWLSRKLWDDWAELPEGVTSIRRAGAAAKRQPEALPEGTPHTARRIQL